MDHTDAADLSRTVNEIVGERWPTLNQVLQHDISVFFKNSLPVDADGEEVAEETLPELQDMNSDSELGSLFEEVTDLGITPESGTTLQLDVSPIDDTQISYLYEANTDLQEAATNSDWAMQHEPSTDGSTVGGVPLQAGTNAEDVFEQSTFELQRTFEQGLTDTNDFAEFWKLADQAAACDGTTEAEYTLQADAGTSTEDGPGQILIESDQISKGDHTDEVDFAEAFAEGWQTLGQAMWDDSNTERTLQADASDGEVEDFECSTQQPAQRDQIYPQNANGAWPIPLEKTMNGNHSDMEELVQKSANGKCIRDVLDGVLQQPAGQGHNNALNTEGARPLTHQVPSCGSTTELRWPLTAGSDFDEEGIQELRPIATLDHTDMSSTKKDWPLLHHEVWYGNYTEVEQLLQAGTDVREVDDEGEIALHHAAWQGFNNIAISLLDGGADPNARDGKGQTPLHHAASNGSKGVVCVLLDRGADPELVDNQGRKPILGAEKNHHLSVAEIRCWNGTALYIQLIPCESNDFLLTSPTALSLIPVIRESSLVDNLPLLRIQHYNQTTPPTSFKLNVILENDERRSYFLKRLDGHDFAHEFESLSAIHEAIPSLCPRPVAHGKFTGSNEGFLLTEFINVRALDDLQRTSSHHNSLAQKLAQLHRMPKPWVKYSDTHYSKVFGFHVPTYVGGALYTNTKYRIKRQTWTQHWSFFFLDFRLRPIWQTAQRFWRGPHPKHRKLYSCIINKVVPRLLSPDHLGGEDGIEPALVHGQLWSENTIRGVIGREGDVEDMVSNPASFYAHSEYDLAAMRMFGEYSSGFFKEYHRLVPKTEPVEEYEARQTLYQV
ncbi:MAG: hypothetical protein Q9176_005845 [Flavoplaca citrina]